MIRNIFLEVEIFIVIKDKGIYFMKIILIVGFNIEIFYCFFIIRKEKYFLKNFL